jgi:integrase
MSEEENNTTYTFNQWQASFSNKGSRRAYFDGVRSFLSCIYQNKESTEELAERYIQETKAGKRNYVKDLVAFIGTWGDRPPLTLHLYLSGTKSFLLYCRDIDIPTKTQRMLRQRMPKGRRARTVEDELTRDKLRKILLHCDVRLKALILVLLSSGIRIGEALRLTTDDIVLDSNPPVIHIRGEYAKEGEPYNSFISSEAKEALLEWLPIRADFVTDNAYRIYSLKNNRKYGEYYLPLQLHVS